MKRTDVNSIKWPRKTTKSERILVRQFTAALKEPLSRCSHAVLMCSGGLDSTVLSHAAILSRHQHGLSNKITLLYINHGLRIDENKTEIEHVFSLVEGVPVADAAVVSGNVPTNGNLQATAREIRYNELKKWLHEESIGMTAHHADDEVETRLFQFLTGRRPNGIARDISFGRGRLIRPLLKLTQDDIADYAAVFDLKWCDDSSNATDKYTRNKLRNKVIPFIEKELDINLTTTLAK